MKKKILGILASLLVICMFALPMYVVFASESTSVEGFFYVIPTGSPPEELSIRTLGESGNAILTWTDLRVKFVGTIKGFGVYNAHVLSKSDGTINAHGVVTLNAMVMGITGVLTIKMESYNWRIISGTDGLESLHGVGTLTWDENIAGLYYLDGNIHFDP